MSSSARTKKKFAVRNLTLVEGTAPAALENLPAPDAVFIGGTKGEYGSGGGGCAGPQPGGPRLHFSHCAGDALCCGGGPDGPRPAGGGLPDLCQPRQSGGQTHLLMANPIFLITRADEAEKSV